VKHIMRSTDPRDYQELPQRLAVMAKRFSDGFFIDPHQHLRDQLIDAVSGVMRIGTSEDAWLVPPDQAVLMQMPEVTIFFFLCATRCSFLSKDC